MRGYLLIASTQNVSDMQKYSILFSLLLLLLFFLVKIVMGLINQELLLPREQSKNIQPPLFSLHAKHSLGVPGTYTMYYSHHGSARVTCGESQERSVVTCAKSQCIRARISTQAVWCWYLAFVTILCHPGLQPITEAFNPIMILLRIREEGGQQSSSPSLCLECPEHAPLWGTSLWQDAQSCFCFFKKDVYPY